MATTVADHFIETVSHFPAIGAQAIDKCREDATAKLIESGLDDMAKPLNARCGAILRDWGISSNDAIEASDNVVAMLAGTDNVNVEALAMMLTAALVTIGYNKFMSDNNGTFVRLSWR